jgi:hypothetical protein
MYTLSFHGPNAVSAPELSITHDTLQLCPVNPSDTVMILATTRSGNGGAVSHRALLAVELLLSSVSAWALVKSAVTTMVYSPSARHALSGSVTDAVRT